MTLICASEFEALTDCEECYHVRKAAARVRKLGYPYEVHPVATHAKLDLRGCRIPTRQSCAQWRPAFLP
uniref:Uncharacterized protein n=1 Tax=Rangifer tarandus platyrhynchus TaxID=3082113 RepID=A0ACB0EKD4_RANTA|nr:unnamed protein product [Rangifer tarandus platyrhynchus]